MNHRMKSNRNINNIRLYYSIYYYRGDYWEAVQSLLSVGVESAGAGTVERAALRAARLVRDHLSSNQARQVAPLIAQR